MFSKVSKIGLIVLIFMTKSLFGGEIEVFHWWTSDSEAKAAQVIKDSLSKKGHTWKDFVISGGGGENAQSELEKRIKDGNPPAIAQIKGENIKEFAKAQIIRNINKIAKKNNWNSFLDNRVMDIIKYKDDYMAVPIGMHKVNWMWVNPYIFKKANAKIPTTWEEFEVAAKKIQKAGYIPVAHGGQAWQEFTLFETIVLGIGGADFYKKVFVDNNLSSLKSNTMVKVFETFKMVKKYTDKNTGGRSWNVATKMIYNNKAAMQFMGDWALGEFKAVKKIQGIHYAMFDAPQTHNSYIYDIDSFVFFDTKDESTRKAQDDFAQALLEDEFQSAFNNIKGSSPVKPGLNDMVGDGTFRSIRGAYAAMDKNTLVPSYIHGMIGEDCVVEAMSHMVSKFFNSNMSAKKGAKELYKAVKEANHRH